MSSVYRFVGVGSLWFLVWYGVCVFVGACRSHFLSVVCWLLGLPCVGVLCSGPSYNQLRECGSPCRAVIGHCVVLGGSWWKGEGREAVHVPLEVERGAVGC